MKPRSVARSNVAALAAFTLAFAGTACANARAVPAGCRVEFLFKAPDRPYDRLGDLLRHVQDPPPEGAWEALKPEACAMGADAVVVERSQVLNLLNQTLVAGYGIRWRTEPPAAPPAAPSPPAELPEAPPPELKPTP